MPATTEIDVEVSKAVAALLSGDATLTTLLAGGGVYFHRTPKEIKFDAGQSSVTHFIVGQNIDEDVDAFEIIVQVDSWSRGALTCKKIAARVRGLLLRQPLAVTAGRVANVLLYNDLGDLYEEQEQLHHRPLQFRIFAYSA